MSTPINDGEPAFPEAGLSGLPNDQFIHGRPGMTLRDHFAAKALPVIASGSHVAGEAFLRALNFESAAVDAYRLADAMLKARSAGHVDEATRQLHRAANAAIDALTDERADDAYKAEVASLLRTAIANTTGNAA